MCSRFIPRVVDTGSKGHHSTYFQNLFLKRFVCKYRLWKIKVWLTSHNRCWDSKIQTLIGFPSTSLKFSPCCESVYLKPLHRPLCDRLLWRGFELVFSSRRNKKALPVMRRERLCAQDWIRTSTPVKALPPQSSVSTNFTTWAFGNLQNTKQMRSLQIRKDHGQSRNPLADPEVFIHVKIQPISKKILQEP